MSSHLRSSIDTPFYDGWKQSVVRERERLPLRSFVSTGRRGRALAKENRAVTTSGWQSWQRVGPKEMLQINDDGSPLTSRQLQVELNASQSEAASSLTWSNPMLVEQATLIETLLVAKMEQEEEVARLRARYALALESSGRARDEDAAAARREIGGLLAELRSAETSDANSQSICDALRNSLKVAVADRRHVEGREVERTRTRLATVEEAYHARYAEMSTVLASERDERRTALEASLEQLRAVLHAKQAELDDAAAHVALLQRDGDMLQGMRREDTARLERRCARELAAAEERFQGEERAKVSESRRVAALEGAVRELRDASAQSTQRVAARAADAVEARSELRALRDAHAAALQSCDAEWKTRSSDALAASARAAQAERATLERQLAALAVSCTGAEIGAVSAALPATVPATLEAQATAAQALCAALGERDAATIKCAALQASVDAFERDMRAQREAAQQRDATAAAEVAMLKTAYQELVDAQRTLREQAVLLEGEHRELAGTVTIVQSEIVAASMLAIRSDDDGAVSTTTLEADEIASLRAMFEHADKNGDGTISVVELMVALRHDPELASTLRLPAHIHQEDGTRAAFERVFAQFDDDHDRLISWDEFLRHVAAWTAPLAADDVETKGAAIAATIPDPDAAAATAAQLEQSKKELDDVLAQLAALGHELDIARAKLQSAEDEKERARAESVALRANVAEIEGEVQALNGVIQEREAAAAAKVDALTATVEELRAQAAIMDQDIADSAALAEERAIEATASAAALEAAQVNAATLENSLKELRAKAISMDQDIATSAALAEERAVEATASAAALEAAEASLKELRANAITMDQGIATSAALAKEQEVEAAASAAALEAAQASAATLEGTLEEQDQAKAAAAVSAAALEAAQASVATLEGTLRELREKASAMDQDIATSAALAEERAVEAAASAAALEVVQASAATLEGTLEELRVKSSAMDHDIAAAAALAEKQGAEASAAAVALEAAKADAVALEHTVAELRRSHSETLEGHDDIEAFKVEALESSESDDLLTKQHLEKLDLMESKFRSELEECESDAAAQRKAIEASASVALEESHLEQESARAAANKAASESFEALRALEDARREAEDSLRSELVEMEKCNAAQVAETQVATTAAMGQSKLEQQRLEEHVQQVEAASAAKAAAAEEESVEWSTKFNALTTELSGVNTALSTATDENQRMNEQCTELTTKNATADREVAALQERAVEQEEEAIKVVSKLSAAADQAAAAETKLAELRREHERCESELATVQREHEADVQRSAAQAELAQAGHEEAAPLHALELEAADNATRAAENNQAKYRAEHEDAAAALLEAETSARAASEASAEIVAQREADLEAARSAQNELRAELSECERVAALQAEEAETASNAAREALLQAQTSTAETLAGYQEESAAHADALAAANKNLGATKAALEKSEAAFAVANEMSDAVARLEEAELAAKDELEHARSAEERVGASLSESQLEVEKQREALANESQTLESTLETLAKTQRKLDKSTSALAEAAETWPAIEQLQAAEATAHAALDEALESEAATNAELLRSQEEAEQHSSAYATQVDKYGELKSEMDDVTHISEKLKEKLERCKAELLEAGETWSSIERLESAESETNAALEDARGSEAAARDELAASKDEATEFAALLAAKSLQNDTASVALQTAVDELDGTRVALKESEVALAASEEASAAALEEDAYLKTALESAQQAERAIAAELAESGRAVDSHSSAGAVAAKELAETVIALEKAQAETEEKTRALQEANEETARALELESTVAGKFEEIVAGEFEEATMQARALELAESKNEAARTQLDEVMHAMEESASALDANAEHVAELAVLREESEVAASMLRQVREAEEAALAQLVASEHETAEQMNALQSESERVRGLHAEVETMRALLDTTRTELSSQTASAADSLNGLEEAASVAQLALESAQSAEQSVSEDLAAAQQEAAASATQLAAMEATLAEREEIHSSSKDAHAHETMEAMTILREAEAAARAALSESHKEVADLTAQVVLESEKYGAVHASLETTEAEFQKNEAALASAISAGDDSLELQRTEAASVEQLTAAREAESALNAELENTCAALTEQLDDAQTASTEQLTEAGDMASALNAELVEAREKLVAQTTSVDELAAAREAERAVQIELEESCAALTAQLTDVDAASKEQLMLASNAASDLSAELEEARAQLDAQAESLAKGATDVEQKQRDADEALERVASMKQQIEELSAREEEAIEKCSTIEDAAKAADAMSVAQKEQLQLELSEARAKLLSTTEEREAAANVEVASWKIHLRLTASALFDVLCARDGATVGALSLDAIVAHMRSMSSRGSLPSGGVVVDATAFARDVFIAADRNRNHLLTHKELRSYCEANSGVAQRLFGSHFAWHDVFTDVSTEQAGEFNESEFTNFVAACIGATTAAANDLDGVCSAIETAFTERDSLAKDEWITSVVEISVQHGGPDAVMRVCSQLSRLHAALSAQLVDTHDRVATELAEATDKASHHETNHATAQASMSELEQTHATELQRREVNRTRAKADRAAKAAVMAEETAERSAESRAQIEELSSELHEQNVKVDEQRTRLVEMGTELIECETTITKLQSAKDEAAILLAAQEGASSSLESALAELGVLRDQHSTSEALANEMSDAVARLKEAELAAKDELEHARSAEERVGALLSESQLEVKKQRESLANESQTLESTLETLAKTQRKLDKSTSALAEAAETWPAIEQLQAAEATAHAELATLQEQLSAQRSDIEEVHAAKLAHLELSQAERDAAEAESAAATAASDAETSEKYAAEIAALKQELNDRVEEAKAHAERSSEAGAASKSEEDRLSGELAAMLQEMAAQRNELSEVRAQADAATSKSSEMEGIVLQEAQAVADANARASAAEDALEGTQLEVHTIKAGLIERETTLEQVNAMNARLSESAEQRVEQSRSIQVLSSALGQLISRSGSLILSQSGEGAKASAAVSTAAETEEGGALKDSKPCDKVGWLECTSHLMKHKKKRHCWLLASGDVYVSNKPSKSAHKMWLSPSTIELALTEDRTSAELRVKLVGGAYEKMHPSSVLDGLQWLAVFAATGRWEALLRIGDADLLPATPAMLASHIATELQFLARDASSLPTSLEVHKARAREIAVWISAAWGEEGVAAAASSEKEEGALATTTTSSVRWMAALNHELRTTRMTLERLVGIALSRASPPAPPSSKPIDLDLEVASVLSAAIDVAAHEGSGEELITALALDQLRGKMRFAATVRSAGDAAMDVRAANKLLPLAEVAATSETRSTVGTLISHYDGSLHEGPVAAFAKRIFEGADRNGDNLLTHSELRRFCRSHTEVKDRLFGAETHGWKNFFSTATGQHAAAWTQEEFVLFVEDKCA